MKKYLSIALALLLCGCGFSDIGSQGTGFPVLATDGAVGTPSYAFASDPDTGMYRGGNGVVSFASNGGERLRLSGSIFMYTNIDIFGNYLYSSNQALRLGGTATTGHGLGTGDVIIANGLEVDGTVALDGIQADLAVGSCTTGTVAWDTGGATVELCYCNSTNNWECFTPTTTNGPVD